MLTVAELAVEVRDSNRRLTDAVNALNIEVAKINTSLAFIRRCALLAIPLLAMILVGGIGASYKIVWDAARTHASVESLQNDIAEQHRLTLQMADSLARLEKAAK